MPSDPQSPLLADDRAVSSRHRSRRRMPLLLKRKPAARYCGFALATWDRMSAAGKNPEGQRVGGGRFYLREELAAWCRAGCPERTFWREQWAAIQKRRMGEP